MIMYKKLVAIVNLYNYVFCVNAAFKEEYCQKRKDVMWPVIPQEFDGWSPKIKTKKVKKVWLTACVSQGDDICFFVFYVYKTGSILKNYVHNREESDIPNILLDSVFLVGRTQCLFVFCEVYGIY